MADKVETVELVNDKIDMFCRDVLTASQHLYGENKLYDTFLNRLSSFRIENITTSPSQKKLVSGIKLLDEEWVKSAKLSYIEVLHNATTRLIYLLTVEGLWERAVDAVIETVQNHIPFHTDREHVTVQSESLNLMNTNKENVSTSVTKFKNERWLIAYVILAMYVSVPENIVRLKSVNEQ